MKSVAMLYSRSQDEKVKVASGFSLVLAIVIMVPTTSAILIGLFLGFGLGNLGLIYALGVAVWFASLAAIALVD